MSDYGANFGAVQNTIGELTTTHQKILNSLSEFESHVQTSINEWLGEPKNEYDNRRREWNQATEQMGSNFKAAISALENILANIQANEQRNTARYQ